MPHTRSGGPLRRTVKAFCLRKERVEWVRGNWGGNGERRKYHCLGTSRHGTPFRDEREKKDSRPWGPQHSESPCLSRQVPAGSPLAPSPTGGWHCFKALSNHCLFSAQQQWVASKLEGVVMGTNSASNESPASTHTPSLQYFSLTNVSQRQQ